MDHYTLASCISLILILWPCIHLLLLARRRSCSIQLPPGPVHLPIVGNLFKLGNKPNESLSELAKTYGPLMTLRLGRVTTVVVSSTNMAKEILHNHDQAFAARSISDAVKAASHNESSVIWLPSNSQWRKLRMIFTTQMLTTKRLDAHQGLRHKKVQELVAHVHSSCMAGRAVDIGQAAFVTTLNLITNTVFSTDLIQHGSDSAQEFKDLVCSIMEEVGRPNLVDCYPILKWVDPQGIRRRITAHFKKLHGLFDRMIEERLTARESSDSASKNDILDAILDRNGFDLGLDEIRALLADIFVAGSDTSSTTVEWAMAELLRNPNAMTKVRSELAHIIGLDRPVEEPDITRLPYLQAVVKETLRLHPPAPLIPRRAEADVEIHGFVIPKHTQVLVNAWAIGRDADIWSNPTSFFPERFLDCDIDFKGHHFELIPFGAGRRVCVGLPLAYRMVHLMLASLLQLFDWKLPDGIEPTDVDMHDNFGITLHMALPLRAIPTKV
ncbi:cytochrome P450 76T24-like [Magnolia sinica]|uniref:cytochrome P450 76T24-like n=1 Tax=Magnolia sinica TaxID=86752 RepID=UPI0026591B86|nr:cytochrome P450 76T24-like [Magnolia sinica]